MIILNSEFLNTALAVFGIFGWAWVWWKGAYKTGSTIRTQVGVMIFGVIWVLLSTADLLQDLHPTSLTITSRALLLVGLWCCMPLLRHAPKPTKPTEDAEDDDEHTI